MIPSVEHRLGSASRIKGRGAIVRSLRGLMIRTQRYSVHRARGPEEQMWAARLTDRLAQALEEAIAAPGVDACLAAVDARARRGWKVRRHDGEHRSAAPTQPLVDV